MVVPNTWSGPRDISRVMKVGGYVLLVGILVGITFGVYAFFNPGFFMFFLNISEYEAPSFFLGIYLPGLIAVVAIGYFVATRSQLTSLGARRVAILCTLIVLCMAISSLSIFNVLAVGGSIIILAAAILAQTKPSFKILWKREASFLVETGSMLIVSASMLFLLMLYISIFFRTYSPGVYTISSVYPYTLLGIGVLSLLTFVITPAFGLKGSKTGFIGILAVAMSLSSFFTTIQNDYVYSNPAVYQGLFLLGVGIVMGLAGAFIYFRLFLTGEFVDEPLKSSFLYKGLHCPHCGITWKDPKQHVCPSCNQNIYSGLAISFCPHCGRLISSISKSCPHCGEDASSLPVHIAFNAPGEKEGLFKRMLLSLGISAQELFATAVLFIVFNFVAFISYVRVQSPTIVKVGSETIRNYGFPLEWLQVIASWASRQSRTPGLYQWTLSFKSIAINYSALILDFSLYFLLAFAISYGIFRLRSLRTKLR